MTTKFDIVVIGGGPSGMAAAKTASEGGARTLLIEREKFLGGILLQCIHNGFGLKFFNEELTGPEYASKMKELLTSKNLTVLTSTFVTEVKENSIVIISAEGAKEISFGALILATGCRERTAGAIALAGTRPAGLYTAGQAQKMINHLGKLPGKEAVILGSGDIGLIMARRLTFEGVKVKKIYEIMPTSSGLKRNIKQCAEDFNIPIVYNTTIAEVLGRDRVTGIYEAKVDSSLKIIESTRKLVKCDCVLLSVGLIPEVDLLNGKVEFNPKTSGSMVNDLRQTSKPNIFSCGNCLHIHDLADNASEEGIIAANGALTFLKGKASTLSYNVLTGDNISYAIPNTFTFSNEKMTLFFRTKIKVKDSFFKVMCEGKEMAKKYVMAANPGEMQEIEIDKTNLNGDITIIIGGAK